MTAQEMMMILGPSLAGGIGSAVNNSQQNKQNQQSQQNTAVQQQMQMLAQKAQILQGLQQNRQGQAQAGLSAMPLGQEQAYASRAKAMQALMPMLAKYQNARPTDPGIAGATRSSGPNLVQGLAGNKAFQDTFSDQMTSQAMADRRKAVAGVNPQYEFSSLGGYGMDASYDQGVNDYRNDALSRLEGFEGQQQALANQQVDLATQQGSQSQQQEKKKGGGIGGFLGGVLKVASPFAALIPGVGPLAAMGLGAAGSAIGGKLQGQGLGGMLGSAAMGAGGALGTEALQRGGNPFSKGGPKMNNGMTSASMPQMGVGAGGRGPQLQLQNSMPQQMTPFSQGAQQQAPPQQPQLPMFNKADPRGGQQPPQKMPQPPIPFASSHGPQQQGQQQPQPSTNIFGQQRTPQLQQMMDQIMGTGIAKGYTQGGLNMGMMGGLQGAMGAAAKPQMPSFQSGAPARNAAFNQQHAQAVGQPSVPTQMNAQNIMRVLSGNNGMSQQDKAKFLASPEAQGVLQQIMRGR